MAIALVCVCCAHARADPLENMIESLKASDIRFPRSGSKVPFPRIAILQAIDYGSTKIQLPDSVGGSLEVDQKMIEQGAGVPFVIGRRDMVIAGEWLSYTDFESRSPGLESFDVLTFGLPVGWLRQATDDWQLAAFVFPLAHKASLPGASWSYEAMMGAFGRYVQSEDVWWAFGAFADVGAIDDYVLPYVGVSWNVNDEWTLSAIMPWPAVYYAPTDDLLFRLGASLSETTWTVDPANSDVGMSLSAWDFGVTASYRVRGNLWLSIEAGVGGFRGFQLSDSRVQGPELNAQSSGYVTIGIGYRPSGDF